MLGSVRANGTVSFLSSRRPPRFRHAQVPGPSPPLPSVSSKIGRRFRASLEAIDDPGDVENGSLRYEETILRFDLLGTVRYEFLPDGFTIDDDFNTLDASDLMARM